MGLPISAIEQNGRVGFGEYATDGYAFSGAERDAFMSDTGKRLGLPIVTGFDSDTP